MSARKQARGGRKPIFSLPYPEALAALGLLLARGEMSLAKAMQLAMRVKGLR
jgi:hypothetical protein